MRALKKYRYERFNIVQLVKIVHLVEKGLPPDIVVPKMKEKVEFMSERVSISYVSY